MSELSVRETAARALYEEQPGHRQGWKRAWDRATETDLAFWRAEADAVLAAVADHDGLADVLRGHKPVAMGAFERRWYECSGCDETAADRDRFDAHLADVVRAWLKGDM